ncbi:MAG: alpha/beta hydrolase [Pseudomonadota bacterium]|nr:alpha/beta hydrolase [Pseudomonadota bacterium]
MATELVEVTGGPVEVGWFGRPRAPGDLVLVLLHEGLGSVDLWRDFPDRLAARTGLPVMAYSRHGYGRSAPCTLPRPLSYMHDDARIVLPDLLAKLGIDRYVPVGHSDGGSITLIHAASPPHPGLAGIVTMAAHVYAEPCSISSIAAARQAFANGRLREALARWHGDNVDCAFLGWADAWLSPPFAGWNLLELLPAITVPSLILQGETDEYGTDAQVRDIAAGVSGPCTTRIFAACGHAPQKDQPELTLDAIADFLAGL